MVHARDAVMMLAAMTALTLRLISGDGGLTVRVVRWDESSGRLAVFLPMHNLELECEAVNRPQPAADDKRSRIRLQPGNYYRVTLREGNGIVIEKHVFVVRRLTFK